MNNDDASGEPPLNVDPGILNMVMARLIKKTPYAEPTLALEVLDGPYKGVVFAFTKFDYMMDNADRNGFVPVRFETEVFQSPAGFVKDELFDSFSSEVVLAWLHYIHTNNLAPLVRSATDGKIH